MYYWTELLVLLHRKFHALLKIGEGLVSPQNWAPANFEAGLLKGLSLLPRAMVYPNRVWLQRVPEPQSEFKNSNPLKRLIGLVRTSSKSIFRSLFHIFVSPLSTIT